ncbi:MAG: GTPase HflX [Betaproteobacteria bacterium]|nr:GTPase HflX [Betaproteobacteria bacterium]
MSQELKHKPTRAVAAAVQLPNVSDAELQASLTELRQLAKTLGFEVVATFTQQRPKFDSAAYLGVGKRQEMRRFVRNELEPDRTGDTPSADEEAEAKEAAETRADPDTRRADIILVDHEISPMQARNLEKAVGIEVMDRTMVILEIFHRHARSRAARAQVEIVRLSYMAPRLREAAKLAGPQGRQRSGVGGRGAGESRGELDRRKIRERIAELQKELVAIDSERKTQRERRQEREGLARVALVGYTNAGKSTLMRALTGSEVLVADKLFATLDTTVRALHPESVPRVLVSDTVGFIENLPHGLVASFKSTLDEALEASLLLHVIDAADPGFERQRAVTEEVLDEIGAQAVPRILVFNKIDRIGDEAAQRDREAALRAQHPDCIVMSARRAADIAKLHAAIAAFFRRHLVEAELLVPWSAQQLRGEIFQHCEVLEEHAENEGAFFRVRAKPEILKRLREQLCVGLTRDE